MDVIDNPPDDMPLATLCYSRDCKTFMDDLG